MALFDIFRRSQPEARSITEAEWFRLFERKTTKAGANKKTAKKQ